MLLALAAMVVGFGILTALLYSWKGLLFRDVILRAKEVDGRLACTGKVYGERVTVIGTVAPDGVITVELAVGDLFHDVVQVERTSLTAPAGFSNIPA